MGVVTLFALAKAAGGEMRGRSALIPGPPPHSRSDRSLLVTPSRDRNGFIVHSFAGDDFGACRDYVKALLGMSNEATHNIDRREIDEGDAAMAEWRRIATAQRNFQKTIPLHGTVGQHYIEIERGLPAIIEPIDQTIRFDRAAVFKDHTGRLFEAPAIVCAIRDLRSVLAAAWDRDKRGETRTLIERRVLADMGHVSAVQRIRLSDTGKKIERKSLGPMLSGAVLCCSVFEIIDTRHVTVSEGVETALAMSALGHKGSIALCGVSRLRNFILPTGINSVTISAENDRGASEAAWGPAGERWQRSGVRVGVWSPTATDAAGKRAKDANDELQFLARESRAK